MDFDIIIVGAGASGLVAAIAAAGQGSSVMVLERKEKAGKKILATGNGKCNFTNSIQKPECYRSGDSAFAMKVLSCFDVRKTLDFFEELGIYPKERNGYYYPNSGQAVSVVSVLLMECKRLGVTLRYHETVLKIRKPDFTIITETAEQKRVVYFSRRLILSAGGCAYRQLGSDGSGYHLAQSLGHTIIKPLPALVPLKSPDKSCKAASGVRTIARVTLFGGRKRLAGEEGEIIFTDYGISGIPVFQVSRFAAKALDEGHPVELGIDFMKDMPEDALRAMLLRRLYQNPDRSLEEMLIGLFNDKLISILIRSAKLDPYKLSGEVSEFEIDTLTAQIKNYRLLINGTGSFEQAQVCAGGVDTGEIKPENMESKLVPNLYLTGELVDVDGTCGGYNLQWAWSSGYLAGKNAGKGKD